MKLGFILALLITTCTAAFTQKNNQPKTTLTTINKIKPVSASAKKSIVGRTDCLQAGDPDCCPSLEMITYYKFQNKLVLQRQERKKANK